MIQTAWMPPLFKLLEIAPFPLMSTNKYTHTVDIVLTKPPSYATSAKVHQCLLAALTMKRSAWPSFTLFHYRQFRPTFEPQNPTNIIQFRNDSIYFEAFKWRKGLSGLCPRMQGKSRKNCISEGKADLVVRFRITLTL